VTTLAAFPTARLGSDHQSRYPFELLNTATEAVVDLAIGRQFHPLARIAKDCAAAAVLVAALSSMMIALLLLVPTGTGKTFARAAHHALFFLSGSGAVS
jgi:diacylglycerol kinase (ATP)